MKIYLLVIAFMPCLVLAQMNEIISVSGHQMDKSYVISGTFGQSFINQENNTVYQLSEGFQQIHIVRPKHEISDDIAVFPNPTNQFLFLRSSQTIKNVSIANLEGAILKSFDVNYSDQIQIDIKDLPSSVYIVKVTYDDLRPIRISKIIKI